MNHKGLECNRLEYTGSRRILEKKMETTNVTIGNMQDYIGIM